MRLSQGSFFTGKWHRGVHSLWFVGSVVVLCVILVALSLRTCAEIIDERDFSLGKIEQLRKARRLLAADSVDAAFVILNMVVGDVEAKKRISREEATAITDAYLMLGEIQSGKQYGKSANYNDYGKAYTCYRKASDMARDYGLTPQLARALLGLGVKYEVQLSSFDDPLLTDTLLSTLKQSLSLAIESKSWETADMAMKNLATAAFSRGRGKEISGELEAYHALSMTEGNVDNNREFVNAFCRTMESLSEKDTGKALDYTRAMEKYAKEDAVRKIDTYSMRAEILFQTGRREEAMSCLDTVGMVAREIGDLWYDMQIEHSKSSLYAALGKKAASDSCLFRYYDLRERLFEDRSANRIKDLHFMSRIDSVTLEMQKITLERQHARVLFCIAMVVVVVFGGMLFMLVRSNRKLRESHRRIFEEYSRKLQKEELMCSGVDVKACSEETASYVEDSSAKAAEVIEEGDEKYKNSNLTEEEKDELYVRIKTVLAKSEAALSSRYQIKDMAAEAELSARTISQVINERSGGNFASLLAEHRVNTACRRINESASYRRLTIEAMAASVGIQSRSYFSTTFKKIVGLNPSEYIRQAEKKMKNTCEQDK